MPFTVPSPELARTVPKIPKSVFCPLPFPPSPSPGRRAQCVRRPPVRERGSSGQLEELPFFLTPSIASLPFLYLHLAGTSHTASKQVAVPTQSSRSQRSESETVLASVNAVVGPYHPSPTHINNTGAAIG